MEIRAMKTSIMHLAPVVTQDDVGAEQHIRDLSPGRHAQTLTASKEAGVLSPDDAVDLFTHAPVSLWEEDFSEVKRRFDQLKANGVEDLRKHFKKHPEEVLSLARMVTISRVNEETLKLYDAAGSVEFQAGLSLIFNKDSYEIFKDEIIAFWKGRTLFASEAVTNGDLIGMHLTNLVTSEEQDKVHALLRNQAERIDPAGPVLHVRHRSNGTIPVLATANTIEINDANVIAVSFTPADEAIPARPAGRKARNPYAGLGNKITQREREILRLICSGKTSRAIANQLCISNKTVDTHRARIMQKLDIHCVVDLVKFAMANGLAKL
jgi:DNA-binding CsgD family transcriptional regulator